jgi:hypothetical protein
MAEGAVSKLTAGEQEAGKQAVLSITGFHGKKGQPMRVSLQAAPAGSLDEEEVGAITDIKVSIIVDTTRVWAAAAQFCWLQQTDSCDSFAQPVSECVAQPQLRRDGSEPSRTTSSSDFRMVAPRHHLTAARHYLTLGRCRRTAARVATFSIAAPTFWRRNVRPTKPVDRNQEPTRITKQDRRTTVPERNCEVDILLRLSIVVAVFTVAPRAHPKKHHRHLYPV